MAPQVEENIFAHVKRVPSVDIHSFDPTRFTPDNFDYLFEDRIAHITFNRGKFNEFTFEAYAELRDFFEALHLNSSEIDLVVLRGANGNFSIGGDIQKTMVSMLDMSEEQIRAFCEMTLDVVQAIKGSPVPVAAVLQGFVIGGGATIAAASHLRFADDNIKVEFPYQSIGLPDCDMGTFDLLADVVGEHVAREWLAVDARSGRVPRVRVGEASIAGFVSCSQDGESFEVFVADEIEKIRNEWPRGKEFEDLALPLLSHMERGRDETVARQLAGVLSPECRRFVLGRSESSS